MLISLLLVLGTTVTPFFEAIVRIFKENYSTGVPWIQLLFGWGLLNLVCVLMVGMLERGRPR